MANLEFNLNVTVDKIADKTARMVNSVKIRFLSEGQGLIDSISGSVEQLEQMATNALDLSALKDTIISKISGVVNDLILQAEDLATNIAKQALLTEKAEDCGRFVKSVSLQLDKVDNGLSNLKKLNSINNMISFQNLSCEAGRASKKISETKLQADTLLSCASNPSALLGQLGSLLDSASGGLISQAGAAFNKTGFSVSFDVSSIIPPLPQIQLPELPELPELNMGDAMKVRSIQSILDTLEGEVKDSVLGETFGAIREEIMQLTNGIEELANQLTKELESMTNAMNDLGNLVDSELMSNITNGISGLETVMGLDELSLNSLGVPSTAQLDVMMGDMGLSITGSLDLGRLADVTGISNLAQPLQDVIYETYNTVNNIDIQVNNVFDISVAAGAGLPSVPNKPEKILEYFNQTPIDPTPSVDVVITPKSTDLNINI